MNEDLERFYALMTQLAQVAGQGLPLREFRGRADLPDRGVYFFAEPGEFRAGRSREQRIVRVGTHALTRNARRTTLRNRLIQHLGARSGNGNHRGSVFRLHLGAALLAREGHSLPSWGVGSSVPPSVRANPAAMAAEEIWERRVSEYIGKMPELWVAVLDAPGPESQRPFIERNAIALLSHGLDPDDSPSPGWLGLSSQKPEIRKSGLWNVNHIHDRVDSIFVDTLRSAVAATIEAAARSTTYRQQHLKDGPHE